eukprot:12917870-Prorocentrum_lima.AAC.1
MEADEVLDADVTICVSQQAPAMNCLLAAMESERRRYGMCLSSKAKCDLLVFSGHVRFSYGTVISPCESAKYLGCLLSNLMDANRE